MEAIWILLKHFRATLKKCDISFWQICQKCKKNNESKKEKNLFSLINLSHKYGKMISFNLAKHLKFDLNLNLWKQHNVCYGYVCYIPFLKPPYFRHTLKTLTKLLIKLNRFYASYYVPKVFWNFFHYLRKRSVTFVTGWIVKTENLK